LKKREFSFVQVAGVREEEEEEDKNTMRKKTIKKID